MSRYILHTRSFHPAKTFGSSGLGFSGDNRSFSASPGGVTSRIKNTCVIDLAGARLILGRTISDPSHHAGMGVTQNYSDPAKQPTATLSGSVLPYREDGDQRFELTMAYKGKNYAFPGADWEKRIPKTKYSISPRHGIRRTVPDLDVTNSVSGHVDRDTKKLHVTCNLRGDGFPNCETFLIDTSQAPNFLCSHIRVGVATVQLWGDRKIPMGRVQMEVDINGDDTFANSVVVYQALDYAGDGSPIDLAASISGGSTSRSRWNTIHTGRDALGPPSRRNMDNSIWEGVKERIGF